MRVRLPVLLVTFWAFALGSAHGAQVSTTHRLQSRGAIHYAPNSWSKFRKLVAALGIAAIAVACGSASRQPVITGTTVAEVFASPLPYPGHRWTHDGKEVPASEIVAVAGPAHCGWQSATFLTLGWPLGTRPQTATGARQFIRDPNHVLPRSLPLDLHAQLPTDARTTGYKYGSVDLYLSPADQDQSVYLVLGSTVERWPRSDPMTLCS